MLGSLLAHQGSRGPVDLSVARASLDFTSSDGVEVILEDARADIAGASPVSIRLPKLTAPIKLESLFSGQIHFASLNLENPRVRVALAGGPAKIPEMGPLMEAVDRISDVIEDQFSRRGLYFVKIRDGNFVLTGRSPRSYSGIDADIFRGTNRVIRAYAKVSGNVSTWRLELARSAPAGASEKTIGVVVNGITIAELLNPDSDIKQGKGLRLPASAKVEARLDSEGKFIASNVVARVMDGWFQLGKTLVAFDDAAISLLFSGSTKAIAITKSHVIRGNTRIFFTGNIEPGETESSPWQIELESEFPQFGSADVPEEPQMMDGIKVEGNLDPLERLLTIEQFVGRAGKAAVFGKGTLQITPDGPYLALAAEAEKVPVGLAKLVWPITIVPPARRWVIEQIKQGVIDRVSYSAAIRPPGFDPRNPDPGWSGNDMLVDMEFSNGAVLPFGELPEVSGLSGTLKVENETLTVSATGGVATSANGGTVNVPDGVFQIQNLPLRDGKRALVEATLTGDAKDLGSIVNSAPFKVLDRVDLKNDGVSGSGNLKINAAFPLEKKVDITEIDWTATAELDDFTDEEPIMGHTIRKADVVIEANPAQVGITGRGVLDGLQADIDLIIPIGESGVAARQDVVVSVTAKQLKQKGIDLTAFLKGAMTLNLAVAPEGQEFVIDLKQTDISLQALGWRKARGVPAKASFKLVETATEKRVQDFRLTAEGANVTGSMRLSDKGELVHASFDTFKLRPDDNADVDIQRGGDGRYDIVFTGSSFDARGLIRSLFSPGGSKGAGDFSGGTRIAATIDKVTGFNGQTIQGFSGKISTGRKGLLSADLRGRLNGRSNFEFTVTDQGGSQLASGQFGNTGNTLRFLDVYKRMSGGRGSLQVALADEDSWVGDFKVRSLLITEDPAIQKIRARETARRNQSGSVATQSQGGDDSASFDALDINFTRESDILRISRGSLQGNALGGTVSGTVNLANQTLSLTGTFVPIYALNNFFAKIPLLGFALGGGSGEGLIGVTYRLSGAVSDPVLSVNPISAIAPGIFRKMFEFQSN
ncbi:DUF3971 domain-containing protein [Rhodobacterales bacterium]|nr:DUF3971 domain-containing protein [Rhodobacterales bacterium]